MQVLLKRHGILVFRELDLHSIFQFKSFSFQRLDLMSCPVPLINLTMLCNIAKLSGCLELNGSLNTILFVIVI